MSLHAVTWLSSVIIPAKAEKVHYLSCLILAQFPRMRSFRFRVLFLPLAHSTGNAFPTRTSGTRGRKYVRFNSLFRQMSCFWRLHCAKSPAGEAYYLDKQNGRRLEMQKLLQLEVLKGLVRNKIYQDFRLSKVQQPRIFAYLVSTPVAYLSCPWRQTNTYSRRRMTKRRQNFQSAGDSRASSVVLFRSSIVKMGPRSRQRSTFAHLHAKEK